MVQTIDKALKTEVTTSETSLTWYSLTPLGVLLMRDARPFSPADGSWAKGQFPPMPTTVFQALRSALPHQTDGRKRDLQFIGPFLAHEKDDKLELWFRTPNDLLAISQVKLTASEDEENEDEDIEVLSRHWHRTARFQPMTSQGSWQHIQFASNALPDDGPKPMVTPTVLPEGESISNENAQLAHNERIGPRLPPWIRASALAQYLQGKSLTYNPDNFHDNPWDAQVLPHIQMQSDTRQVKDENGYFTEVAIRMRPGWKFVAGINHTIEPTSVRLGGEGHRVLVEALDELKDWETLQQFRQPCQDTNEGSNTAYLLTPGLAQLTPEANLYSIYPYAWKDTLLACTGDRPVLWGGISKFKKDNQPKDIAYVPQRAFVAPGTVYRFKQLPSKAEKLLPTDGGTWLETLQTLNYGTLLWSSPNV